MSVMAWLEGMLIANPPMGAAGLAAVLGAPSLLHTLALGGGVGSGVDAGCDGLVSKLRWVMLGALLGCIATIAVLYWLVRREGIFHVSQVLRGRWFAACVRVRARVFRVLSFSIDWSLLTADTPHTIPAPAMRDAHTRTHTVGNSPERSTLAPMQTEHAPPRKSCGSEWQRSCLSSQSRRQRHRHAQRASILATT
jgi:hypothetical protein